MAISFLTTVGGILALAALAVYFFGIPPQLKQLLEQSTRPKQGDSKLVSDTKEAIRPVATSDDSSVHSLAEKLRQTTGEVSGGSFGGNTSTGTDRGPFGDNVSLGQGGMQERVPVGGHTTLGNERSTLGGNTNIGYGGNPSLSQQGRAF